MTSADRQKAVNRAAYQLLAVETPAVILIVAAMLCWRNGRAAGHVWPASWEVVCVVLGLVICGFAVWRFSTTVKALRALPSTHSSGLRSR